MFILLGLIADLLLWIQVDVDIATHINIYDDGPDRRYDTLICIESNIVSFGINFDKALEFCLQNDQENLELVKECVTSDLGNLYQHEMAQKTGSHSWVPWVMVDGVHDLDAEDKIFESLIDYLCGDDITKCY